MGSELLFDVPNVISVFYEKENTYPIVGSGIDCELASYRLCQAGTSTSTGTSTGT